MLIKDKLKALKILAIGALGIVLMFLAITKLRVNTQAAEPKETQVSVSNEAPNFSAMGETVASTAAAPTNVGATVTFQGTASDDNGDNWFLIICKNGNAPTHNGTSAPECNGGSGNRWCRDDTSAASAASNSCTTSAIQQTDGGGQQSGNSETEAWYAFACDAIVGGSCSAASQGTASDGTESPFYVNHKPTFDGLTSPSANPGGTATFTATYTEYDDAGGTADTVSLYVCKTAGATSGGCTGTTLCSSTGVTSPGTLECNYPVPAVIQDASYDVYPYMYDGHNLESTPATRSATFTVNNVAPTVNTVTITVTGGSLDLDESSTNSTETVYIDAIITDSNNCQDVNTGGNVKVSLYKSTAGGTFDSCDAAGEEDRDSCYPLLSCVYDSGVETCTGTKTDRENTDATAGYKCTVVNTIYYHADPTDTGTTWTDDEWYATMQATDDDTAQGNTESVTPTEVNSLTALDLDVGTLNYGSYSEGTGDATCADTVVVSGTGNVVLDTNLKGDDMDCDNVSTPSCTGDSIVVGQQHYALAPSTAYGSGVALTGSDVEAELNCPKTTYANPTTTVGQASLYWGIFVPVGKLAGIYKGMNYVTAVKGETPW
ncbi:hypothetical protein JW766_00015 [Candidatus Dojkabacteria bacterium]|nr:hypothetical protein [Candidatus Dojkabacteria bacterium]